MTLKRRMRGVRARIPKGYVLGRVDPGNGEVQPVQADDLVRAGVFGSSVTHSSDDFFQTLALSMPVEFSVAGSPATPPDGSFTITKATQAANRLWAGPTSGAAAQPTFRALVAADMPSSGAGSGTVTSVTVTMPAEFSVSGNPITTSGTIAFTWGTETANKVLAGPTSGSAATPGFRSLVAADIPDLSATYLPLHGTADAALKWATARTLSFTGDATGSGSVDGSASVATALTLAASGVTAATYGDATHVPQIAVDAKGRITLASSVSITQPLAANPTATAGPAAVNGSASTFLRSDGAPAVQLGTTGQKGIVQADGTTITVSSGVISAVQPASANPTATASDTAVNGVATTFMRSDAAPAVQKGSSSAFGLVKVDGTTITAASGVITAVNNGTVTSVAMTVPSRQSVGGSPITSSGTLAITDNNQNANIVFAGPTTGAAATPAFRALVAADIPDISATYETVSAAAATYLPLAGGTMSGRIKAADGAAATPSIYWDTNSGFWNDTTNSGVGLSVAGVQVGWFAAGGPTYQVAGGGALNVTLNCEGVVTSTINRYSNNALSANTLQGKARGTIASPLVPVTSDTLGASVFSAYTGAAFSVAASITVRLTETSTVDTTHLGAQYRFNACPIGSGTNTEIARLDNEAGLSMFGANPVIDQNRVFRPRAYTVGTVPAATSTGLIHLTDEGGGTSLAYADGTNWRKTSDAQVVSSTAPSARGLLSLMTTRVSYTNQDIVHRTFQKLSDAGVTLGTDLLGLWVFAGAPGSSADALRNWATLGTRDLTIVGSPTWSQTGGFTGDGTSSLLSAATPANFGAALNNLSVGVYVLAGSASAKGVIGINNAAAARFVYLQSATSGALTTKFQDNTNDTWTPSKYTGMFTLTRGAAANFQASVDDGAQTTVTRTSTSAGGVLSFLGTNDTTAAEYSTAQVAFAFVGVNLTAAKIAGIRAALVDYYLVQMGVITPTVASLPPATNFKGQSYYVPDLGGGAGMLQSDGVNWFRTGNGGYATDSTATGAETITYLTNSSNLEYTAALTGNTTITLAGTDAKGTTVKKGAEFNITRSGLGAFTFAIVNGGGGGGTLTTFASLTAKAARCVFDGTNWRLMMDSNL